MDVIQRTIDEIIKPYDLRGFYNQHKTLILTDDEYYGSLLNKANSMVEKGAFTETLDNSIIRNFIFDLESDKEVFDLPKPEIPIDYIDSIEPASPNITRHNAIFEKPSTIVKIEILSDECDNLYEQVTKELFRMVVLKHGTNQKIADALGLSIRTVRNKRRDYERIY